MCLLSEVWFGPVLRQGAAPSCDWRTVCHVHISLLCHTSAFDYLTGCFLERAETISKVKSSAFRCTLQPVFASFLSRGFLLLLPFVFAQNQIEPVTRAPSCITLRADKFALYVVKT